MQSGNVTVKRNAVKNLELLKKRIECKEWLESILEADLGEIDNFEANLRSGILLVKLANTLKPGSVDVSKVHQKFMTIAKTNDTFKMIENLTLFVSAAEKLGVPSRVLFSPIEFINGRESAVGELMTCLQALKNIYSGPAPPRSDLEDMSRESLVKMLSSAGIKNKDDLARVTLVKGTQATGNVVEKACIVCGKPTKNNVQGGFIYYHKNCIACCKCGNYFMKAKEEGWFWKQEFYCLLCLKIARGK